MLNMEAARKIGINACIDKIGRDFVMANKDRATSAYGQNEDSVFCFVGVDDRHRAENAEGVLVLDSHSEFPYRASCNVNLSTGTTDFIECISPEQ